MPTDTDQLPDHVHVAIVGAGFSGLGMAVALERAGIHDYLILERADDVGGTWQANTYPGCQCDVPSHLYSFSFAPNPDWSRTFSLQPEIWDYLRRCADEHGITPKVRLGHEVLGSSWDDAAQRWEIETSHGSITADVLVAASGGLSAPSIPEIPGLDTFTGAAFHSATWDHSVDLAGKRVAMVGTGASSIQIVPRIQSQVERLLVFQRTPAWIMPHRDRPISRAEHRLYRAFPAAQRLMRNGIFWVRETFVLPFLHPRLGHGGERIARRHLRRQVPDRDLRRRLRPQYAFGCKRVLLSNDFYPALCQPNVELVTDGISEVRPRSIVTTDGTEHEVDAIVFGTGFHVTDMPVAEHVIGSEGRTLAEIWNGSPRAYLGTCVAGFPNMFMLLGPNTGLGHNSVVYMVEAQIAYVSDCLKMMQARSLGSVDVRADVLADFTAEIDRRMQGTVWMTGGCASWYIDSSGRNSTLWPDASWRFRRRVRRFDLDSYEVRTRTPQPVAARS